MEHYKVGDKVKVVRRDLDIFGKTATVTDAALPNSDFVLVMLDSPDTKNPSQIGPVSLHEAWLTSIEAES